MGLMHGPHKQGAQHESKQVNQAVLIIDAGNQHDQQQNAEHHAGAGGQNEDVFLAEQNAVCTGDRKSTRLNSSHVRTSYAVFCLKKKSFNISREVFSSSCFLASTISRAS